MEPLIALLVLILIGTPIIAAIAFFSARRVDERLRALPIQELRARLDAVERHLKALENLRDRLTGESPAQPVAPTAPQPVLRVEVPPPAPMPPAPPPRPASWDAPKLPTPPAGPVSIHAGSPLHPPPEHEAGMDLESLIGGRWLNRIGIIALLASVTFFLKYAFDNNWIGPTGRVGIGVLLGALMLPWSQWLLTRGYNYFSEGIVALGAATLYVSIWAGCQYYTVFSRDTGFFAMIIITAVMAAVAIGRNSQRIAFLSLLGGFLTPVLVSSGRDEQVVLFSYLLVLGAGFLLIAFLREWVILPPLSFVFAQLYFWGWYEEFYHRASPLERTLIFATLFFLLYAAVPVLRTVRQSQLPAIEALLHVVNAFAYLGVLYALLWPQDRWPLTLLVLALGAAHIAVVRLAPLAEAAKEPLRLLFAGLALTFATLAIPIRLDGNWMTLAFAVESAVLCWTGFRSRNDWLRHAGYVLLVLASARLLIVPPPGGQFLFNERFASSLALIGCFAAILWAAREAQGAFADLDEAQVGIIAVAINVCAVASFSVELWELYGRASTYGANSGFAQHLSLTVFWVLYASALIGLGVQGGSALLRWQALALFGLAAGKVFLFDFWYLEKFYRILSAFALGILLVIVSFLYQKKIRGSHSA